MRKILVLSAVLLLTAFAFAQTVKPAAKPKPVAPAPAVSQPAAPIATSPALPTVEQIEGFFKRMFGYDPNMTFKVAGVGLAPVPNMLLVTVVMTNPQGQQISHWYMSPDQKWLIAGELFPYGADPFLEAREDLQKKAFGPTKGPADAKFTIVEFADLECPGCAKASTTIEQLQQDYPNLRFIYQSYPLTAIHPWSLAAASYLDCVQRANNDKSWVFITAVFAHQEEINQTVFRPDGTVDPDKVVERLKHYAAMAGFDAEKIGVCAGSPETLARVQKSLEVAHDLRVGATPTVFLNGRQLSQFVNVQYEALKSLVDYEISQSGK